MTAAPSHPVPSTRLGTAGTGAAGPLSAARDRRREAALAALSRRVMPLPGRPLHQVPPVGYDRRYDHDGPSATITDLHGARRGAAAHGFTGSAAPGYSRPFQPELPRPALTDREIEVLCTWLKVDSKPAAAAELGISLGTVNTHLTRIRAKYTKVGRTAATKAALVARAVQDDLMALDEL